MDIKNLFNKASFNRVNVRAHQKAAQVKRKKTFKKRMAKYAEKTHEQKVQEDFMSDIIKKFTTWRDNLGYTDDTVMMSLHQTEEGIWRGATFVCSSAEPSTIVESAHLRDVYKEAQDLAPAFYTMKESDREEFEKVFGSGLTVFYI